MSGTLLEKFFAEECTAFVCDLVRTGLRAGQTGTGPRRKSFEFNRFEVTFDLDQEEVLIEDVLDASEAGAQRIAIAEFCAALAGHQSE